MYVIRKLRIKFRIGTFLPSFKKKLKAKIISFGQKLQKKITLQFRIKRKLEFQKTNGKKILEII